MRAMTRALFGLAVLGAVVASIGWYLSATAGHEEDFASCQRSESTLVLHFMYGSGQSVWPKIEPRGGGDLTVSLHTKSDGGMHTMEGIGGEAWFSLPLKDSEVFYPDGRPLDCTRVASSELGSAAAFRDKMVEVPSTSDVP